MATTANVEDTIRVVVSPSQASYFAGEPFSVTVTFSNTRGPDPAPQAPRSASQTHKRSAHSISSVPLSRPPTSPGLARSAIPVSQTRSNDANGAPTRKGLIGTNRSPTESALESTTKKPMVRSLSIAIISDELALHPQEVKGKSPLSALRASESQSSPRVSSPLARSASLPVAPTHPHARKQSVMDGQLQLQDLRPPASLSPFTPTPSASTSTYSLALNSITESNGSSPTLPPQTPTIPSPIPENTATFRTQISSKPANPQHGARKPSQLGYGPPPSAGATQPPRTAFSSTFPVPNTELILYSYAQLVGTLSITPPPGAVSTPEQTRALQRVRANLLKRRVVGGGSMDITPLLGSQPLGHGQPSSAGATRRRSHSRSSSVSSSLLSYFSPTPAPQPWTPTHRPRTSSVISVFSTGSSSSGAGGGVGLGLGAVASGPGSGDEDVDPETPLPTLEVPPAMLAVDLSLAPGESRSYTYSIVLPDVLPPTYRGRALRLSYHFILGVCRAAPRAPDSGHLGPSSSSRVMKVPIRVYTNVIVGRSPSPYNLLWPASSWLSKAAQYSATVTEESKANLNKSGHIPGRAQIPDKAGTFEDLQDYARNLLASNHEPNTARVRVKSPLGALDLERDLEQDREREEAGGLAGCRQAVEMLTRNPRKASYDVTKDGVKVAVLTFTKSAYRLGETVLGVVELNERQSRARVLKLSAMLEAHESLPGALATTNTRQMRRVHAEHHSSFVPATLRTTFSLDIPPDASPAFAVDVDGAAGTPGGLEWKVRLCLLVAVAAPTAREGPDGVRLRHLVRDGRAGDWGVSWGAARTIAPSERPDVRAAEATPTMGTAASWISYFTAPLLGPATGYHDGDEEAESADADEEYGAEDEWRETRAEMVECEVPIRVWPGNTAFKATEVVFGV
ncbi:Rgp1-domain-containing protein [Wolfiporia cocos MD-104 SS10]|uniref:Rgp1-domain-containing protein n=1 Tax=Wolfiporia cocos (strain MD-104) TaxID=742152 RepID=A0A2H3JB70_WOLCO|nr:Rgp1-domain-containing protein [Wolfiporia cocos MD-104 SS10]